MSTDISNALPPAGEAVHPVLADGRESFLPARDSLTVLRAHGPRLAKLLHADGRVQDYDRARTFDVFALPVPDLDALRVKLAALLHRPDCCVVRGVPFDPARVERVRRLLHRDERNGDVPTLQECARCWLALDVEGVPRSAGLPASDLAGCAAVALAALPPAFRGPRCVVQASAGHGFKPDLRLRLWFWLSRPMGGGELKRWLRGTPADPSVFGAAQPIYTAAPLFAPGLADPLPVRMVALDGRPVVDVPAAAELAPARPPARRPGADPRPPWPGDEPHYVRRALVRAVKRITGAAVGGRHPALVSEARALARFVEPGLLTAAELRDVLRLAAEAAGKDDADEIEACIEWGLAQPFAAGKLPGMGGRHG